MKWKTLKKRCVLIEKGEKCIKGFDSGVKPSSFECFEYQWHKKSSNPVGDKETIDKAGNVIWN